MSLFLAEVVANMGVSIIAQEMENDIPGIVLSFALEFLSRSHLGQQLPNLASSELLLLACKVRLPQDLATGKIR